jgi:hypothetical protein
MAVSKRSCRTLQDIHTLSGSFDRISRPDKAFMKIACLEMEKARRGTERENALHRLKNIDARLQEIEAEKAALLEAPVKIPEGSNSGTDGEKFMARDRAMASPPPRRTSGQRRGERSFPWPAVDVADAYDMLNKFGALLPWLSRNGELSVR